MAVEADDPQARVDSPMGGQTTSQATPQATPVFFDRNGARWRQVKVVLAVLLLTVGTLTAVLVPRMLAPVQSARVHQGMSAPKELAGSIGQPVPIIGQGFLVRVVRVRRQRDGQASATDPFSGQAWAS